MIAHWMLYCIAIGTLLCAAALAAERALHAFRLPQRWAWAAALLLALGVPAAARWAPRAPDALPPVPAISMEAGRRAPAGAPAAAPDRPGIDLAVLDRPLSVLWVGMSAASLLALVIASVVLARRGRRWRRMEVDGVPVLVSRDTGPAVIGFVRGRIVLPAWAVDADAPVRGLLLEHEREHLRARDPQLLALGWTAVVLMPWNPAVWWQMRRLRLAVEVDCDARVLARRADVRTYGALLLEVGRRASAGLAAAAFSEPRSFLERRIRIMTDRMQRPRVRTLVPVLALGAATLAGMRALPLPAVPAGAAPALAVARDTVPPHLRNAREIVRALQREYPPLLRDAGVRGEVHVRFTVTPQGTPADAVAERSSDARFTGPALRAIQVARFDPARIDGRPAPYTLVLPLLFAPGTGAEPATNPGEARGERPWDTPPVVTNADEVVRALRDEYPPLLRDAGITARAEVELHVSETGEVLGVQAVSATHPEAGPAAERAMRRARFRPARRNGQPVAGKVMLPVLFEPAGGTGNRE